jgi:parallel beta-helix repeat protein
MRKVCVLFLVVVLRTLSHAQEPFVINSLADDQYSHAYDDPATAVDESRDGICRDEKGRCTLRAAIEEAENRNTSAKFTFTVSGKISLIGPLTIDDHCIIDGGNQIELSGTICLDLQNYTVVRGLRFSHSMAAVTVSGDHNQIGAFFSGFNEFVNNTIGLVIDGDSNVVINNYIGVTSKSEMQPNVTGIMVTGNRTQIGSGVVGDGNTICGNTAAGIELSVGGYAVIQGNMIGTDTKGTAGLGNNQGITIGGSKHNTIGGTEGFEDNVIAGNTTAGIYVSGAPPDDYSFSNKIVGNLIGVASGGTAALPNGRGIIITNGASFCAIEDNIIAGNSNEGISLFASDTNTVQGHTIGGNTIGMTTSGKIIPNGTYGIGIDGHVSDIGIGFDAGVHPKPNSIAGNGKGGVSVQTKYGYSPNSITVQRNKLFQNARFNLSVDTLSNARIRAPYGLSLNNHTLAGIADHPNYIADVYKASITEFPASAYEWLGSTTSGANGVFAFTVNDPTVQVLAVTVTDPLGGTSNFATLELLTGVKKDEPELPAVFALAQNYPNPFNPSTTIRWQVPESGWQTLKVYDMLGQEVATLVDEYRAAGIYETEFPGVGRTVLPMASGIYVYTLQAGAKSVTKHMALVK